MNTQDAGSPLSNSVATAFAEAVRHHRFGNLHAAEISYRRVLAMQPRNADSLQNLGLIAHQVGRSSDAAALIMQAIAERPDDPQFHCNLGLVLEPKRLSEPPCA